ncbi:MAG: LysR family transcriptional regulator [Burkholderiales bacterium]|nr:LysR family transcriptional regulator [Burkholderiales bacterium]
MKPGPAQRHGINLARLDLVTLKLFVAVVEEQSILKAAEREHIAASAVSKRIADLEHATHTQLLHRHRKGVEPTEAGTALLHHARTILHDVVQLESEIMDFAGGVRGHVRLMTAESALFGYVPDALASFAKIYPEIGIDIATQSSAATAQAVVDGTADLGIFWGDAPTNGMRVIPCYSDRLVVVASANHPLARFDKLKFAQVLDHELIEQEAAGAMQAMLVRQASMQGRVLKSHVRVMGYDAVCRMVQAQLGLGIVPQNYAARLSPALGVVAIALDEDWVDRGYKIGARGADALSPATKLLLDYLVTRRV